MRVSEERAKGKRVLEPFDYLGVTLDGGRPKAQFEEVRDYYLGIPLDDLLHGYWVRAGLPAPGKELGGWYTGDMGNVFPQIMSGLARMYAATHDARCQARAYEMLTEWAKCIAPDGYFFYTNDPTSRQYYYEKVVGALVDMFVYGGDVGATKYLGPVTNWAVKNLKRGREYANAVGDRASPLCDHSEWYTVSENLYRAYMLTGEDAYRDFGRVWEYTDYWDIFSRRGDIFAARSDGERTEAYHAYSHVNTFSSAAAAYLVTGERHYLDTLTNAYEFLQSSQVYATGGYGPDEQLTLPERVVGMLRTTDQTFETQCGTWAAFKMAKYLTSFTGDARYGDWVERLLFNGIGASLPMTPTGQVFYYASYRIGGAAKQLYPDGWSCCTGTRPQATADYYDQIYYHDAHSLCVSLYLPSSVRCSVGSESIHVKQETNFPENPTTAFKVSCGSPTRFRLKLRVPEWLASPMTATLNGKALNLGFDPHRWAVIDRTWHDGDRVEVRLPMKLWTSRMGGANGPGAVLYGPVVLAFTPFGGSLGKLDLDRPEDWLTPVAEEFLAFRLLSKPDIRARPFYDYHRGERYEIYLEH